MKALLQSPGLPNPFIVFKPGRWITTMKSKRRNIRREILINANQLDKTQLELMLHFISSFLKPSYIFNNKGKKLIRFSRQNIYELS